MATIEFDTYKELSRIVDQHEGIVTCQMWALRDTHGVGRLGPHVVASISEQLAKLGLAHYPEQLPLSQWEAVRIYRVGTPVGGIIKAVLSRDPDDGSDEKLRSIAGGAEAEQLQRIRDIVCG